MSYICFACGKFLADHIMFIACYSQYNVENSLYCKRNFFCHNDFVISDHTVAIFQVLELDVVSLICCSMCCISARQFHPSTFLPLNKWHLIGVFLGQCVSCHILVFLMWRILWLSIVLSWANMATSTFFVFKCIYHMYTFFYLIMQPTCLLATFMFPTIIGGVRVCSCYFFCIH